MSLLRHVSKIVSILLSKLSDCPNTDTSLCYYNNSFLTVHIGTLVHSEQKVVGVFSMAVANGIVHAN